MDEQELRELITAVKAGRVSRRSFMRKMVGLGLTAPFVSQLLALYFRFPLGLRMVEELLAARGIIVTHETDNGRASSVSISPTKSVAAFPGSATNGISMRSCSKLLG